MRHVITWDTTGPLERLAVVELCGWCNKMGYASPTGKRIAKTSWNNLTPAAKRILTNHGIK